MLMSVREGCVAFVHGPPHVAGPAIAGASPTRLRNAMK